jgi:putative ABC transport system permease protein
LPSRISFVDISYINKIESIPGVKVVAPLVAGVATNVEGEKKAIEASPLGGLTLLLGVNPTKNLQLKPGGLYNPKIAKGRSLKPGDRYTAIIGATVADEYKKSVGSTIEFNGEKFKVVGVYESGTLLADSAIAIPIDIAQELTGKNKDTVSTLYVEAHDPQEAERIATKINFMFEGELEAKTASGYSSDIGGILSNLDLFFMVISSVALLIGAIGILNTMLMSVMERTKEFGILKAVGWTGDDIIKLVVYESFFLGIIGGVFGCVIALVGIEAIGSFLPFQPVASIQLVAYAFILAVILGIIGGVYPAWRASKLDPVQAIRYE